MNQLIYQKTLLKTVCLKYNTYFEWWFNLPCYHFMILEALKPFIFQVGELEGFVERLEAELYEETRFTKWWAPSYTMGNGRNGDRGSWNWF